MIGEVGHRTDFAAHLYLAGTRLYMRMLVLMLLLTVAPPPVVLRLKLRLHQLAAIVADETARAVYIATTYRGTEHLEFMKHSILRLRIQHGAGS